MQPKVAHLAWMLFFLGLLTGFVVEDGDLSSIDTTRRLQVAHALWTSEPPVREGDYPDFGVVGRDGKIHAWYGIGQSLIMLPADVLSSALVHFVSSGSAEHRDRAKVAVVVYTTFPLLTAGCVVLGYLVLLQLGLGTKPAALGAMGMLFGTTLLQWTQVNQENNLTLLCFLGTLYACLRWLATGRLSYMALAGCSAGLALLTRLPTVFETATVGLLVLALLFAPRAGQVLVDGRAKSNWLLAGGIFCAVLGVFVAGERLYHFLRFGSFVDTYIGIHKTQNPGYYVGGDWWSGVWTLLFSPQDSVFWMDPGILLFAALLLVFFARISPPIKVLAACLAVLLLVLVAFYAPYPWPGGASGWGSRYTTTPAVVFGLLGFGLMAHFWRESSFWLKAICLAVTVYALMAQIGSLLFWSNLEQLQWQAWGGESFLVGQRWMNAVALLEGTFDERGLMVPALSERLIRPNFMPFHLRAELGAFLGILALVVWFLLLVAMVSMVVAVWRTACKIDTAHALK
jgi:hypothetical protein